MKIIHTFALLAAVIVTSVCLPAQSQLAPPEKETTVYGASIKYFEAGAGQPVLLLHGLGAVKEVWMGNFGALSAKYHVYALDQVGFGHSDKPLLDYKIATFSDFLFGFMRAQNLNKATLVGNSLGGWIAIDFASRHPEMVDKIVLVDAAGLPWAKTVNTPLNSSTMEETRSLLASLFYDKKFVTEDFVTQVFTSHVHNNDSYTIHQTIAGFMQNQFVDTKLASIHAPTLIVWGHDDELLPASDAEKFRAGITGAKLVVFDHCGHVPQIEKAADFNQALLDFLGQ